MKRSARFSIAIALIFWVPVIFFSLLLAHNAMLYFTHSGEYGILPEKIVARQDLLWNISFYVHLPTGVTCLLSPVFLFGGRYLKTVHPGASLHTGARSTIHGKRQLEWHERIGKLYVWTTLILVCPTGMYLAVYAKGGLVTQTGFMIQGVLLGWFTWQGYQAITRKDKMAHVQFMMRSYAVATVVLTFRILHILFFFWAVPYKDNYAISQWLGLTINLLLAEVIIALAAKRFNRSTSFQSHKPISYENH
jgi:hypothetical protein